MEENHEHIWEDTGILQIIPLNSRVLENTPPNQAGRARIECSKCLLRKWKGQKDDMADNK